jgi:hypothetical protein
MEALAAALADRPPGKPVKLTEVRARIPRHASSLRVAEVLTDLELLENDSVSAVPHLDREPHRRAARRVRRRRGSASPRSAA